MPAQIYMFFGSCHLLSSRNTPRLSATGAICSIDPQSKITRDSHHLLEERRQRW